tara:strand:+ start:10497 stop:11525 length:1029 start_codon:yes stop_codon:yes gene_type:complete
MEDLDSIYAEANSNCTNKLCEGCSILKKSKPVHCHLDYEDMEEVDVLFVSDSFKYRNGVMRAFGKKDLDLIREMYPGPAFGVTASVKCPSVKDKDQTAGDLKICRQHLEATIDKLKPTLVYACGNLPMRMFIKRSGISNKRGSAFPYVTEAGTECVVVPIYHPFAVIKEPKNRFLFEMDIKNGYDKYILKKIDLGGFEYHTILEIEELRDLAEMLTGEYSETIAGDIETTGFNFLTDELQTIAIATPDMNWVIPCDHKDSPFGHGTEHRDEMWSLLAKILGHPLTKKIFHNTKFDLKFLLHKGIKVSNVHDTKLMHHLFDENLPKGLMDLVKLYFPHELASL